MSNEPFRMTCTISGVEEATTIYLVSPELPQATAMKPGLKERSEATYQLAVTTPVRFELHRRGHAIAINRETGEVTTARGGWEGRFVGRDRFEFNPLPKEANCFFESL